MIHKRKFVSIILVFFLFLTLVTVVMAQPGDLEGHWAKEQINSWSSSGLISGYPDGTFRPEGYISRAEFFTLINRVFGLEDREIVNFSDVPTDAWYYDEIAKAVAAGYVSGYPDGTIRPHNYITRQEAAVVVARAFALEGSSIASFTDSKAIASWASDAVGVLYEKDILKGYPDGSFGPNNNIKRAETVALLSNAGGNIYTSPGSYTEDTKGNVVINTGGVILKNMTIGGDLYLAQGIGDGDVTLEGVTVQGVTYVWGGGEESIYFRNSRLRDMVINRSLSSVRVVAEGNTLITGVTRVDSGVKLESKDTSEIAFKELEISERIPSSASVQLAGHFGNVTLRNAAMVSVAPGSLVNRVVVTESAQGARIESSARLQVEVQAENVFVNNQSFSSGQEVSVSDGGFTTISAPPRPSVTVVEVSSVGVEPSTMTLDAGGATGTLIASIEPGNATNKGIEWTSSHPEVATVVDGIVTPLSAGTTTIMVTSLANENIVASCIVTVDEFAGGVGTLEDPYRVASAVQLNSVRNYLDAHFILVEDINLSLYSTGEGWEPIGTSYENAFMGTFDGNGYSIENLTIDSVNYDSFGLFGYVRGASIENVTLLDVDITGRTSDSLRREETRIGSLVGYNREGTVKNSSATGVVRGERNSQVGGLVGYNSAGLIEASFADVLVISEGQAGGLIGNNSSSALSIHNSYATGDVEGYQHVGGLVGRNSGEIQSSYATGQVRGYTQVGGLVGGSEHRSIRSSYATGNVVGNEYVGGLIGYNNSSKIYDSYASGSVTGGYVVGGLIGYNYSWNTYIENCYAVGAVLGEGSHVGGLLGMNYKDEALIVSSYYDLATTGQTDLSKGERRTSDQMVDIDNFNGWDFENTWQIAGGYPYLKWQANNIPGLPELDPNKYVSFVAGTGGSVSKSSISALWGTTHTITATPAEGYLFFNWTQNGRELSRDEAYTFMVTGDTEIKANFMENPFAGGSGTVLDPYLVDTALALDAVRYYLDKHFRQVEDIDLIGYDWEPIGEKPATWEDNYRAFSGQYDGNGRVITNLTINSPDEDYVGLFSQVDSTGQLMNVSLRDVSVLGHDYVGSLAGRNLGSILGSSAIGSVEGYSYVGGLVGSQNVFGFDQGVIEASYTSGSVSGYSIVGGLLGYNWQSGKVLKSFSSANVVGDYYVGGLVGQSSANSPYMNMIENSYATGSVTGNRTVGGLVGYLGRSYVINSYAVGTVSGDTGELGGLIGYTFMVEITNSYYDVETTTKDNSKGSARTTQEMMQQLTFNSWDFESIWEIEEDLSYPYLRWQEGLNIPYSNQMD